MAASSAMVRPILSLYYTDVIDNNHGDGGGDDCNSDGDDDDNGTFN